MTLKLLHAADLHLDSPLKGLTRSLDGELGALAARCTLDAFTRVIDVALRERVDAVLLAGDLFDRKDRSLRARLHLQGQLARLGEAGIPSFLVAGNHDPLMADEASVPLPPGAHRFGASWSEVLVERPGGRLRVQGMSYPRTEVQENLAPNYRRLGEELTVGVLHANVGTRSGHLDYAPCSEADLAAAGLDYWALGHVHTREQFPVGTGLAAYPGNPQGRHVREEGPRGCLLVELEPDRSRPPRARFVPTDVLRWHALELDVAEVESVDVLVDELVARTGAATALAEDVEAHAVRLTLTGATPLHRELLRAEAVSTLEEALSQAFATRGWILESVELATRAGWELSEVLASGGLAAEVARLLAHPPAGAELEALWTDAKLAALDTRLTSLGLGKLDRLATVETAVRRALDLVLEEG